MQEPADTEIYGEPLRDMQLTPPLFQPTMATFEGFIEVMLNALKGLRLGPLKELLNILEQIALVAFES
ncbi:MAG: hypothetical protein ACFBSF_10295 [Leptolyngbyaceae cyanobacterium]